jgi:hypothetical protein
LPSRALVLSYKLKERYCGFAVFIRRQVAHRSRTS